MLTTIYSLSFITFYFNKNVFTEVANGSLTVSGLMVPSAIVTKAGSVHFPVTSQVGTEKNWGILGKKTLLSIN